MRWEDQLGGYSNFPAGAEEDLGYSRTWVNLGNTVTQ